MLIRTLYVEQASYRCRGLQPDRRRPPEGTIGVGMPVVALPLLSLFVDIKSAAMLLSMPLIFSNLPQALEGGQTGRCLMQLLPVILGMIPGLFLGVRVLLALDANVARMIAGLVLMGVGGVTMLAPKLHLQPRLVLPTGITFGFFGGIWEARGDAGTACFHISACKGTARTGVHKGGIAISRRFRRFLAILLTASSHSVGLTFESRRLRCCRSCSACTSDNTCATKLHLNFQEAGVDRSHCRRRGVNATWFLQLTGWRASQPPDVTLGHLLPCTEVS